MPSQPSHHIGVIVNRSVRRAACDQCHTQKLRCTKLENYDVCVRCERLNRQCNWSVPSRSGRPAKSTAEGKLARRDSLQNVGEKRRKRSFSALELTPENSHLETPREHVCTGQASALARDQNQPQPSPLPLEMAEAPPSLPSIVDWNMSDFLGLSSPRYGAGKPPFVPSWIYPDSPSQMHNFTDCLQLPNNGVGYPGTQATENRNASGNNHAVSPSPGVNSLQDITREISNINLSLFDLEQSLNAEPWGPMFATPAAAVTKLSTCSDDQADDWMTQGYPLVDIFNKTQRFIEVAKQTSIYFASRHAPNASTPTSSSTSHPGQPPSKHPLSAAYADSDTPSQASSHSSIPVDISIQPDLPPQHSAPSSNSTQSDRPSRTASHVPTALLFATGYARILDIYTTLSTQISNFVHALSVQSLAGEPDNRQRMHPAIPPLQWGAFQPANYGGLQILMATQVLTYLLKEVERAVGFYGWEREMTRERSRSEEGETGRFASRHGDSRRRRRDSGVRDADHGGGGQGLLSSAMIEIVVQADGSGNWLGKVGVLRSKLRMLKEELEKSMHS
ncbi:hypothetical protein N7457_002836 [Penicillium paradoxum]|uniref:uncharacterized protein n=1 Tax=Penicillium paradoxum TaxID=176176 RepID=UPI0025485C0A|nr:uncharacterized protein N7457_002836 [Penicillium paradoxum]KAJ5787846.1 hypothetical protein N7457_002836 [Penicillium paradoxum]